MSGVLQGTVLGPLLFSLHSIDIMSDIESKTILFAAAELSDNCVSKFTSLLRAMD